METGIVEAIDQDAVREVIGVNDRVFGAGSEQRKRLADNYSFGVDAGRHIDHIITGRGIYSRLNRRVTTFRASGVHAKGVGRGLLRNGRDQEKRVEYKGWA